MRRNLFLYLALACLAALVAIFVLDGYRGIYDTVYVTATEMEQKIGPDFWQVQPVSRTYSYQIGAEWGETVHFRYQINNRSFSTYSATVEASLWKSNEKLMDLFRQDIRLSNFDEITLEWTLSSQEMIKAGLEIVQYTIKITRGEIELGRGIVLGFYNPEEPGYPKPVPPELVPPS
jgi:hypothetical protein